MTVLKRALLSLSAAMALASPAAAQTDYYNTDAGRPLTIEDAYPVERRAFELQLAPVRLERARGGVYTWGIEPEMAYGIFPRTHLEVGVPVAHVDGGFGRSTTGIAGIEVGVLHNLNVETAIPALAVAAEAIFPAGSLGPSRTFASAKGIATRTLSFARFHLNGQYTFGEEPTATERSGVHSVSRWLAGLAIDRALPLRSMLLGADVVARQPIHSGEELAWSAGAGIRWQYSPRLALDAGIGRQITGDEQAWSVTFGSAYAFGLPWHPR